MRLWAEVLSNIPESLFLIFSLRELLCFISEKSLRISHDTWRLAGREPPLERSTSVSVQPCNTNTDTHTIVIISNTTSVYTNARYIMPKNELVYWYIVCKVCSYRLAVGHRGQTWFPSTLQVAAGLRGMAGHRGTPRRHKTTAAESISMRHAKQDSQTWNVLCDRRPVNEKWKKYIRMIKGE